MKNVTTTIKIVCLLVPLLSLGQNQETKQDIYTLFDNVIGRDNLGIYNGIEYREKFKTLNNNHPYFDSSDFILGSIEYDGQSYYNINLKHNLYNQEVIAKLKSKNDSEKVIKLYNYRIGSFTLGNKKFIYKSINNNDDYAFYEEGYNDGDLSLLIKHQKFKKDLYQNGQMFTEFVPAKKEYFVLSSNNFREISSKKDIGKLFPDFKPQINQFYRDNRSLEKSDYDQFLIQLLQELKLAKLK